MVNLVKFHFLKIFFIKNLLDLLKSLTFVAKFCANSSKEWHRVYAFCQISTGNALGASRFARIRLGWLALLIRK